MAWRLILKLSEIKIYAIKLINAIPINMMVKSGKILYELNSLVAKKETNKKNNKGNLRSFTLGIWKFWMSLKCFNTQRNSIGTITVPSKIEVNINFT